ncbi:hypothetical protein WPS_29060 [Vulcanimicrobium alpinum]|uniref:Thiol-disulfide oxidoreductase DCC family protein n=1 Tax=Vulcanimicrobium alpinum TaxID=3016050 RepID=A0AAN1XZ78_UNVUL|nr:DCC1-like thiol-disulfide oxidoreductase family protein [Vulcanimicrobium alpinum]BDE07630.1 hypothetical protein WPS_29060 [Vulcanimicrobium alpinum]
MNGAPPDARAVVLFDGMCNLCSGAVRFIAANDPGGTFAFASLQSARATELLAATGGPPHDPSVVLLAYGRRYEGSDAALHIALGLRFPWPLAFGFILVPRTLRDRVYGWIAANRYRWFGRRDACAVPPSPGGRVNPAR